MQYLSPDKAFRWQAMHLLVLMEGLFIVRSFKSYNKIMLATRSKVVWIVAVAYLTTVFALASGLINSLIEGRGINRFMIPSRSAQTVGETVVFTLILFMGMAGAFMLYYSGRSPNPKVQKALLIAGFGVLGIALLLGFILVGVKL
jgi:dolichyl-phosphate-mannose--protein O-mannosyl transferase